MAIAGNSGKTAEGSITEVYLSEDRQGASTTCTGMGAPIPATQSRTQVAAGVARVLSSGGAT